MPAGLRTVYADTGFLCSVYAPDAHTRRALNRMKRQPLPLASFDERQAALARAVRLKVPEP